jgi:L-threonylcarbamoyladenylate synthase
MPLGPAVRRVYVDPDAPQRDAIEEAATWIRDGGVIAMPTDTLYGLAADPFDAAAVRRVFAVKGRAETQPLPLVAADEQQIRDHLGALTPTGRRLAARFWPGPLTLIVEASAAVARGVTAGTGRVAVRVPSHAIARAVCAAAGRPVTATSANISGEPPTASPADVERTLGDRIDFLLDVGPAPGGLPSTIVDVTGPEPRLIRAGAVAWDEVRRCLQDA